MTYKNIKQFLRWSFWILIACLAICFFYAISGIWGILYLLALLIFSGLIIFAGWAFAYGIDVKFGDWDRYWFEQAQKKKKQKQKLLTAKELKLLTSNKQDDSKNDVCKKKRS